MNIVAAAVIIAVVALVKLLVVLFACFCRSVLVGCALIQLKYLVD